MKVMGIKSINKNNFANINEYQGQFQDISPKIAISSTKFQDTKKTRTFPGLPELPGQSDHPDIEHRTEPVNHILSVSADN